MRDDIRRAFDDLTDAPHPALRAALRTRLDAGVVRAPSPVLRLAAVGGVVAVLALAVLGGYNLLSRGGGTGVPQPAGQATSPIGATSPSPDASPDASPAPTPSPTASPSPLPAFACATVSGGDASSRADVTAVRVGTASGYDRFVIEFDGPVPAFTVSSQATSAFMQDATGATLQLQGSSGVKVVVHGASGTDLNGRQTFFGSTDLKPGSPVLKEARQTGDFERVFSWGLGLSQPACLRVMTLTGPDRLVVDVEAS